MEGNNTRTIFFSKSNLLLALPFSASAAWLDVAKSKSNNNNNNNDNTNNGENARPLPTSLHFPTSFAPHAPLFPSPYLGPKQTYGVLIFLLAHFERNRRIDLSICRSSLFVWLGMIIFSNFQLLCLF